MSVRVRQLERTGRPRQLGLSCRDDKQLLRLHRDGLLAQVVNYRRPLNPQNYVELDCSIRSRLETETLVSVLGERSKLGEHRFLQVPPHLEILRDRLFYLLLAEIDWEASAGDISEQDYRVDRGKTTLCFFDDQRRLVALLPGGEIDQTKVPGFIPPDLFNPQIEVASLIKGRDVTVLDAGIGRSTTIYSLMRRLQELGKQVKGYGLNLTEEISPAGSAVPIFTGIFEDYPFPIKFDLVYSQVGSSFYTPNIPKFARKIAEVLKPGGIALFDIAHFHLWQQALTAERMDFSPLYNISSTAWIDAGMRNPAYRASAKALNRLKEPSGLLIRMP
jgi:SAM-dependent methyltransferase